MGKKTSVPDYLKKTLKGTTIGGGVDQAKGLVDGGMCRGVGAAIKGTKFKGVF